MKYDRVLVGLSFMCATASFTIAMLPGTLAYVSFFLLFAWGIYWSRKYHVLDNTYRMSLLKSSQEKLSTDPNHVGGYRELAQDDYSDLVTPTELFEEKIQRPVINLIKSPSLGDINKTWEVILSNGKRYRASASGIKWATDWRDSEGNKPTASDGEKIAKAAAALSSGWVE